MKILLTAIGKRVQLIKYLKRNCTVVGADCSTMAPSIQFVDEFYKVPKCSDEGYIDDMLNICTVENIDLLIPLYEKEFILLCKKREHFEAVGTKLLLSDENIIKICNDKWETYKFFRKNDLSTPISYIKENLPNDPKFPLIIKPRDGMGSSNVFKVNNEKELDFFKDYVDNAIIQEYIKGIEYTIDVLCDLNGSIISVVPRERIEVRSGEVSKSRTVKDEKIINAVIKLCKKLKGVGPLTIQCIVDSKRQINFIEINPRFGGGVPLTFEAGVDYEKYFELMINNENIEPIINQFKEITMLRYDDALFM